MNWHHRRHFASIVVGICVALGAAVASAEEMRTWSDATGKYKIKATFISLDGGKVTLEKADGATIEIDLKKLSKADQKYVADAMNSAGDNPFQAKEPNPFESKSKRKTGSVRPAASDEESSAGSSESEPRLVRIDYSSAEQVNLAATETWQLDIPSGDEDFASKPKTVSLPKKSNFFEGIKGVAVNRAAGKAAVGFVLGDPKPSGTTRFAT